MPLEWSQVKAGLDPRRYTVRTAPGLLKRSKPWRTYAKSAKPLRAAIERSEVLIGYLDAAGMATRRVVEPISVRGGLLNAFDQASGRVREFAVHRITSVLSDPNG